MKNVKILVLFLISLLSFSCKDNINPEPGNENQTTISVDIEKVVDTEGKESISIDNLKDLVLFIYNDQNPYPLSSWSSYDKVSGAEISIPEQFIGVYEFELQASFKGKAYKSKISKEIKLYQKNILSFELKEIKTDGSNEQNSTVDETSQNNQEDETVQDKPAGEPTQEKPADETTQTTPQKDEPQDNPKDENTQGSNQGNDTENKPEDPNNNNLNTSQDDPKPNPDEPEEQSIVKNLINISVQIESLNDMSLSYDKNTYSVKFTCDEPGEDLYWLVDSKVMATEVNTFTFYPKRIDDDVYTITAVNKKDFKSVSAYVNFKLPVDYEIASTDFYAWAQAIQEADNQLKEIYNIKFTDSEPSLYEIGRTLTDFTSLNFALDFSECYELKVVPMAVANPNDSEDKLPPLAHKDNLFGINFGDIDITTEAGSLVNNTNLEYLIFGDKENIINNGTAQNSNALKYVSIGNGNVVINGSAFSPVSLKYISIGNGNNTLKSSVFSYGTYTGEITSTFEMYIGKGETIIEPACLPKNLSKLYIDDGHTIISPAQNGPSEIYLGKGNVEIYAGAYHYSSIIKKIVMQDGDLSIGEQPGSSTTGMSFYNSSLEEFVFGNGDKLFLTAAFYQSNLKEIDLKDGNVTVHSPALGGMKNLKKFRMGNGDFTETGNVTMHGNSVLEEISFGNGKHMFTKGNTFISCPKLKNFSAGDGDTIFGINCFSGDAALETAIVGHGDIQVQETAFRGCKSLKTLTCLDGVSFVGKEAFDGCVLLEQITLNDNCTELGENAFRNCANITFIVSQTNPSFYTSDEGRCLKDKQNNQILYWAPVGDVILPEDQKIDFAYLFGENKNITSLTIPAIYDLLSSTDIETNTALQSITLKDPQNWYYTTDSEDALNKENGIKLEVNGPELLELLLPKEDSNGNIIYTYLYKLEEGQNE